MRLDCKKISSSDVISFVLCMLGMLILKIRLVNLKLNFNNLKLVLLLKVITLSDKFFAIIFCFSILIFGMSVLVLCSCLDLVFQIRRCFFSLILISSFLCLVLAFMRFDT